MNSTNLQREPNDALETGEPQCVHIIKSKNYRQTHPATAEDAEIKRAGHIYILHVDAQ